MEEGDPQQHLLNSNAKSDRSENDPLDSQTLQNITNAFFPREYESNTNPENVLRVVPPLRTSKVGEDSESAQKEKSNLDSEHSEHHNEASTDGNHQVKRSRSRSRSRSKSRERKNTILSNTSNSNNNNNNRNNSNNRFTHCCSKCKKNDKSGKACVCVVPASQRRLKIGSEGCANCGCNGCTKEDRIRISLPAQRDKIRDRSSSFDGDLREFCCRQCMKAVTKEGKPCICHAPKGARKAKIGDHGCLLCGCKGCNPDDHKERGKSGGISADKYIRPTRRSPERSPRHRYDSADNDSDTRAENLDNFDKSAIGGIIVNNFNPFPPLIGFGVPQRTYSYIFGKPSH